MGKRPTAWLAQPITVWIGLGACFLGSQILAASFFPHGYDWRYIAISSLASPRHNPHAYWIASTGLMVSGLLLIPFAFFLQQRLKPFAPKPTAWAGNIFLLGAICLTLSAMIVPGHHRILGVSHEHLAQISAAAFCLSLVLCLGAILRLPSSLFLLRLAAAFVAILPVTGLIVSQLSLRLYEFSFSAPHAAQDSLWGSLALWEWIGAFCLYLFLGLLTFEMTATGPRLDSKG